MNYNSGNYFDLKSLFWCFFSAIVLVLLNIVVGTMNDILLSMIVLNDYDNQQCNPQKSLITINC